jgi:hypothetical protein
MVMERGTVCWMTPEVATTLTVVVTAFGLDEPPHPMSTVAPMKAPAMMSSDGK